MKKVIYGLLIATSITGASAESPKFPAFKTDSSICSNELTMVQLNELKKGSLKLGDLDFNLHTSKEAFDAMLPKSWQFISKGKSLAKIEEGGRAVVSTTGGHALSCRYTFRTASGSKLGKEHTPFTIVSQPDSQPFPEGLAEAVEAAK